jgi:peptide/nickel transport system ATP-binding protein
MAESILDVRNLQATYRTTAGVGVAVDGVSFRIIEGRSLGLIGESGCGKTTVGRAIIRVMPANMRIAGGEIYFKGQNLSELPERAMRDLRWRAIAMVPQSSMHSLDPVYRLETQMLEVLCERGGMGKRQAKMRAAELFTLVGLAPARLANYPHELSGGMKQRAVIAMALALHPSLIIADEPVTALDVIVQEQVLKTIRDLQDRLGISVIMITHDMSVVAQTCQDVAVMYAGKIVESGPVATIFHHPVHPYTIGLERAFPNLLAPRPLVAIEGHLPSLLHPPKGCRFAPRCPFALPVCREQEPPTLPVESGHSVACHRMNEAERMRTEAQDARTWQRIAA